MGGTNDLSGTQNNFFRSLIETEGLLPCSRTHHRILSWARWIQITSLPPYFFNIHFNEIHFVTSRSSSWPVSVKFSDQTPLCALCFSHVVHAHFFSMSLTFVILMKMKAYVAARSAVFRNLLLFLCLWQSVNHLRALRFTHPPRWLSLWLDCLAFSQNFFFRISLSTFFSMCFFSGWWGAGPSTQPATWRTSVSLFVWVLSFDLSGKGGPTSSYATAGIALWIIAPRKKNWMEGIRKAMNERNLNEGQWEDRKQWSLDVGQRRTTFWNRYMYIIYIYIYFYF